MMGGKRSDMTPSVKLATESDVLSESLLRTGTPPVPSADVDIFTLVANMARNARGIPPLTLNAPPTEQNVLEAGVRHAIHQFLIAVGLGKVDEVHSSSSLMGFIGANVNIFNLLSAFSKGKQTKLGWSAQRTSGAGIGTEGKSGGDFGIILPVENEVDKYRLAFFQAKRETVDDNGVRSLNINQLSNKKNYAPSSEPTEAAHGDANEAEVGAKAEVGCAAAMQAPEKPDKSQAGRNEDTRLLNWLKGKGFKGTAKYHQISKLASTEKLGRELTGSSACWVHYVLWPNEMEKLSMDSASLFPAGARPMTVSLEDVRAFLGKDLSKFSLINSGISSTAFPLIASAKSNFKLDSPGKYLYCGVLDDLICSGIHGDGTNGWLTVSMDEVQQLVGSVIDAGVIWVLWDDTDGGLIAKLANTGMQVTEVPTTLPTITVAIQAAFPNGIQSKTPGFRM